MSDAHWMSLVTEDMTKLPTSTLISNNGISVVYRANDTIYKRSIPFMIENEIYCLKKMYNSGYVPSCFRYDKYTIATQNLGFSMEVTDCRAFMIHKEMILQALKDAEIRHGDITEQSIIVVHNKPFLIDFAESRLINDPRPDKRPEGDKYWLDKTFEKLCMKRKT